MRDLPQLKPKEGIALVLSGGATKAFYFHLGVLKVLGTDKITSIVGSSAGAVMGAFIASGTRVDLLEASLHQKQVYAPKLEGWIKTLTSTMLFKPRFGDIGRQTMATTLDGLKFIASLPRIYNRDVLAELIDMLVHSQGHVAGFFDSVALEDLFRSVLPKATFQDTDIDLYVTGTALDTGMRAVFNAHYEFVDPENAFITDVPIHRAVRASTAVPGMFEPVKIKGQYYIDGEIKQTVSADIAMRLADEVVISHTYQPLHLPQGSVRDLGWVNILKQSLNMVFRERICVWARIYQQQNPHKRIIWVHPEDDDLEFFLAPEFTFRPEVQRRLIRAGVIAAERALEQAQATAH